MANCGMPDMSTDFKYEIQKAVAAGDYELAGICEAMRNRKLVVGGYHQIGDYQKSYQYIPYLLPKKKRGFWFNLHSRKR